MKNLLCHLKKKDVKTGTHKLKPEPAPEQKLFESRCWSRNKKFRLRNTAAKAIPATVFPVKAVPTNCRFTDKMTKEQTPKVQNIERQNVEWDKMPNGKMSNGEKCRKDKMSNGNKF
jgi:hypothetical protein